MVLFRLLLLGIAGLVPASNLYARVFVLPHVLEVSGRITNTTHTFDTQIFMTYSGGLAGPGPGTSAFVDLYLFDQRTGAPLDALGGPVCSPCSTVLTPSDRTRSHVLDELITAKGGFPSPVVQGFALVLVNGDYANVNITSTVSNARSSSSDLSVFSYGPVPIEPSSAAPPAASASPNPLGPLRTLGGLREDPGTVGDGANLYDTTIVLSHPLAKLGFAFPVPTRAVFTLFNDDGSRFQLGGTALDPLSVPIAGTPALSSPVVIELEDVLSSIPGRVFDTRFSGYAEVVVEGDVANVDIAAFVRSGTGVAMDLNSDSHFVQALAVPEPDTFAYLLAGLLVVTFAARRARWH